MNFNKTERTRKAKSQGVCIFYYLVLGKYNIEI